MSYLQLVSSLSFDNDSKNTLQSVSTHFIELIESSSQYTDAYLRQHFEQIIHIITSIVFKSPIDGITMSRLVEALVTICHISTCSVTVWESDGQVQSTVISTLSHLLTKTLKSDYHTVIADCMCFDAKSGKCKHNNDFINGTHQHHFVCDFHLHDSLSVHLILACIHNGIWAIQHNCDYMMVMKACLFGLYHDVGKPLSIETYEFKNSTFTGFPAHAEIGAMLFNIHYSSDMSKWISYDDYMTVSHSILRHMCGYHGDQCIATTYKRALLMVEQPDVRQLLTINRVGDYFGKLVDSPLEIDHFLVEQTLFENQMASSDKFNLNNVLIANTNTSGSIKPNKIVIYLIGTSGAGKTHLLNDFMMEFPNNVSYISRDECIAEVCIGKKIRLEGIAYTTMYKIYETGKIVASFVRKISNNKFTKQDKKDFDQSKYAFIQAQEEWNAFVELNPSNYYTKIDVASVDNIPNITEQVHDLYITRINDALSDNHLFLVMDTFMNCFPMAIDMNVPDALSTYFRVHIHVQSYLERKSSSIASTIDDQLKISGPYGLDNPIHPDGFKNAKNKSVFASLSSEIGMDGLLPHSTFASKFRPHLVFICTRTNTGNHGYTEMFSGLKQLLSDVPTIDTLSINDFTKNMNISQYYSYLMDKYHGDQLQICEFLRTLGFIQTTFIKKSDNIDDATFCAQLSQLSITWKDLGVIITSYSASEISSNSQIYEKLRHSIVILKYIDGLQGACFWQNVWAKEMRGTVLFISPNNASVKVLSFKLPRGAEVLTGMVTKNNLETQDIKSNKIDMLDEEQRDTCLQLCNGNPINMHLTSKGDGSLMIVNVYTGLALKIMQPIVMTFGSDYARLWATQSLILTNNTRLFVPATHNTLIESGFMSPYMVTSLLVGSNIVSREELAIFHANGGTYMDAWQRYGTVWMDQFMQFTFHDSLTETHTFSFEAICNNRCGLFGDQTHVELACSYDRDRLIFLGVSLADCLFYIPHSMYNTISQIIPFEEPLWWTITHASQVDNMLDDINNIIFGKFTKNDFLLKFPPANRTFDISSAIIDFEGWVAMKFATCHITDSNHRTVINDLGIPLTIYSKIKTEVYYRAHKFNATNIPYLMELSKTAGHIFPLSFKIAGICQSGAISERLINVGCKIMELLNFNDPANIIIPALHTAFNNRLINQSGKQPKNPLTGFEKRPFNVQCRMVLNFDGFDFSEFYVPIYVAFFPEIDTNTTELKHILKNLTMTLQPWDVEYVERVNNLDLQSTSIQELIQLCIGTSIV